MNCLGIEKIYLYLESELPDPEIKKIKAHLKTCPACSHAVEERRSILHAAENLDDLELPLDFTQKIMERVYPEKVSLKSLVTAFAGGLSAAVLVFVSFFIITGMNPTNAFLSVNRALLDGVRNFSVILAKFVKTATLLIKVIIQIGSYLVKGIVGFAGLLNAEVQVILIAVTLCLSVFLWFRVKRLLSNGETA